MKSFSLVVRSALLLAVALQLELFERILADDVSNHWATYYEKPCCTSPRHVRHHKGKTTQSAHTARWYTNLLHCHCLSCTLALDARCSPGPVR